MDSISDQIRAKKNEIKRLNRELSKLQDEAKKRNAPLIWSVAYVSPKLWIYESVPSAYEIGIRVNRPMTNWEIEDIKSRIESISKSSEPKSYVNWDKIDKEYNWAVVRSHDKSPIDSCPVAVYHNMPIIKNGEWVNASGSWDNHGEWVRWNSLIVGILPSWNKSLIHRPGIKE